MGLVKRFIALLAISACLVAQAEDSKIGVVVMHGKGGTPTKFVSGLASSLEHSGFLVANLEMPWSGRRDYDVDISSAEQEVSTAIAVLQKNGARKVFLAGHSLGGLFAFYFGGKHHVDGIIAIAPGGDTSNTALREKIADSIERAHSLVNDGKGREKTRFSDYENSKGLYNIFTTPVAYLSWFDPDGAMNETQEIKSISPETPVLFIGPTNDYPFLIRTKASMFGLLAKNPLTKLYEPDSNHLGAPSASITEIQTWINAVSKP